MIYTSHNQQIISTKLITYLQQKIGLSEKAIELGIRQSKIEQAPLTIILWSFGLLNLEQYQQVLDWQKDNINN